MGTPAIKHVPFDIKVYASKGVIEIDGDLEDNDIVRGRLRDCLASAASGPMWTIEADAAWVSPNGVTLWCKAVREFLPRSKLVYAPSQLSLILQYDRRYEHSNSEFEES